MSSNVYQTSIPNSNIQNDYIIDKYNIPGTTGYQNKINISSHNGRHESAKVCEKRNTHTHTHTQTHTSTMEYNPQILLCMCVYAHTHHKKKNKNGGTPITATHTDTCMRHTQTLVCDIHTHLYATYTHTCTRHTQLQAHRH
eukprot:GHVR01075938.1.p1 GENE.GHVR01075938.1~~GHVR01075938.1.p1  ORF type:complete len:141 (-),score=67.17 GHVR01075938.1:392-814(-)